MKILLTGSTGYIGRRLLPVLVAEGHHVVCLVRDRRRFDWEDFDEEFLRFVTVLEADLEKKETLKDLPGDIDVAYYLVHSMSSSYAGFSDSEKNTALNFAEYIKRTSARQIIYLSGIVNDHELSEHLSSRKNVEDFLKTSEKPLTVLRAAIIIGSGSASFEIIRDLVEKLPVMVAPKWLKTRCQPIGVRNVIQYLLGVLNHEETFDQIYDIGGPDILTYKQMLMGYATVRKLQRLIITVPVLSPKLSSLWLYFVTSTSYPLARNLVDSMRHDVVAKLGNIDKLVPIKKYSYHEALEMAFSRISQKNVISSWKDAISNEGMNHSFRDFIEVPQHGCFNDIRTVEFDADIQEVKKKLWSIGGTNGWYYGNFLWEIRGFLDKAVGGVGLRRGRRSPTELKAGDALDFWRVLLASEKDRKLLLYAEMKLPGEAWLEFHIKENQGRKILMQKATFRPLGIWGRIYWYCVLPFHFLIFPGMASKIVKV
ncbi:SDR family oxidoreductase [Fulvivirga kasyanovii]|uniref:SDR family oxidoreductase n=1 Tax=Fulvivirga kasyanovii TaxID=396812 RepID=A0ABW9RXI5_9BACT|nr:SDR family oxidoreductase [Fulvivirga kasyanovii]MTI27725.1 SDR family oxidoreductase [Fulvivirga kasyanovii]